jgi:DNA-binding XRE family transcriptional regulator
MTKLRERMIKQGYSNRTLAKDVGCHWTLISKVASGKKTPGMLIAQRISVSTGVPMEDLIATKTTGE